MDEKQLALISDALGDYREGIEENDDAPKGLIEGINDIRTKIDDLLTEQREGRTRFYVWYVDDSGIGDFFSISGIVTVADNSIFTAARKLCELRGVRFNLDALFGGCDLTHGTLEAEE